MCGLVGVYGFIGEREKGIFLDLLNIDLIRGSDSTGVAFIDEEGVATVKDVVLPHRLIQTPDFQEEFAKDNFALIGHNRAATRGIVNPENCHPFTYGDITLVHNGTLIAQWRLDDDKEFDTDSENITYCFNKNGVEDTWKKIDGAATLVWWDDNKGCLNFLSNDKRPFHWVYLNDDKTIVWASDSDMLKKILRMNGIETKQLDVWKPLKDKMLNIFIGKDNKLYNEVVELEPFKIPFTGGTYNHHSSYGGTVNHTTTKVPAQNQGNLKLLEGKGNPNERKGNSAKEAEGKNMTLKEFRDKYDECIFCGLSLFDEYDTSVIVDDRSAVCGDCAETAHRENIRIA